MTKPEPGEEMLDLKGRVRKIESVDSTAVGGGWVVWTKEEPPNTSRPYKIKLSNTRYKWEAFDGKY